MTKGNGSESPGEGAPRESATYKVMLDEVEAIVRDVSSSDLDLDDMVAKIEKGYTLIKTMRTRLDETKDRIEKLRLVFE